MPRGDFDFRISGADERALRRWLRGHRLGPAWVRRDPARWLKALAVAALLWVAPTLALSPTLEIGGRTVSGRRVLLIQDDSGSMGAYQALVDRRLTALRAAGSYSELACPKLSNDEFGDFVTCVLQQAGRQDVDGLYVFADFLWGFTPEGLRAVSRALEGTSIRLYLDTIGAEPPPQLLRLVDASGGAMIHTPK
jgi:hypothetical protein